ncbi:MAG: hypothetical protein NZM08_01860 [Chitinophagales bacterium]|nr:hypothetical protein [Chitinophagales bacterium]
MMPRNSLAVLSALLFAFTFSACRKDASDTTALQDHALAEKESGFIVQLANEAATQLNLIEQGQVREATHADSLPDCITLSLDSAGAGYMLTIDFGTTPCLCDQWDNKYRKGQIIVSWTGPYRQTGTVITIATQDYFAGYEPQSLYRFDYLKTLTNMGKNSSGNTYFTVNVASATITLPGGQTISWTSQRQNEWTQGEATWWLWDDVYSITGSASGTDRNGNPFTVTITGPLIVKLSCPWIVQGTLLVVRSGLPDAELQYGNGQCDNQATVVINGKTYTIYLG